MLPKGEGFAIPAAGGSFLIRGTMPGHRYRSPGGTGTVVPHAGGRRKVTAYGAIAGAGRLLFGTYGAGFNTGALIRHVAGLKRRSGGMAIVLDRAPPRRPRNLRRRFGRSGDARLACLPRGSPYPDMAKRYRHQARQRLPVSEYRPAPACMKRAVSEHFRTSRLRPDMYAYLDRWAAHILKNV